jgi:type IV fimbrial biogenesis protein FimT
VKLRFADSGGSVILAAAHREYAMRPTERGLTLLELITTVAIIAILAGVAVPGFGALRDRTRASTTAHSLTASLMAARMAAISRRHPVSVCPSRGGDACDGAGSWSDGWIVFADPGRAGQPSSPAAVLTRVDGLGEGLRVSGSRGRDLVRYQPDGRASGTNISFRLCEARGERLLARVVVANSGRTRTERPDRDTPCVAT